MRCLLIFIFLLCVSCDYFESKKVNTNDIVNQELKTIDYKSVDRYPSFETCDTISEKIQHKLCFESTLLTHVNNYLAEQNIVVSNDVEDSISINLRIDKSGTISVLNIEAKAETKTVIPNIDSLLTRSIATLPKIYPAIKRAQQVTTELVLPVVVSIR